MEKMINLKINGIPLSVKSGTTILEAAHSINIQIPTLCYLKEINQIGACRICNVEVKGARTLISSCVAPVNEGMEVFTNTPRVINSRKTTLKLILSIHNKSCLTCIRSGNCELQKLCHDYGVENSSEFDGEIPKTEIDNSATHMYRDNSKCILCRRCTAMCENIQGVSVIGANERGFNTHISSAFEQGLGDTACISCGQCITVCPTGALSEKDSTDEVWKALEDETKHVIVQTAPSVRVALGECFGMPIGTEVTGKMTSALRLLGFDGVYDTVLSADLTILEEAHEFLDRLTNGGVLPLITSCSPGWVKFCEHNFPEFIPNISSCKSPQQMFGALAKTWYAQKMNIDPKDIYVVSVMPCTAKKYEINRDNQNAAGVSDVDVVLTTRELSRMITRAGIQFTSLPDEEFDAPLGTSTGAGVIFGASGGVMEAALRTAYEWVTKEELPSLELKQIRGMQGIKEAMFKVGDIDVRVAVCSGTENAKQLINKIKRGEAEYHFIEIMGCPGGCINGGGQPIQPASVRNFVDIKALRTEAIYNADRNKPLRKSHENPILKEIYKEYFGEIGGHKAHEILHTTYVPRDKFE